MGHRGSKAKRQTLGKIKPHMAPQNAPPEISVEQVLNAGKSPEQVDHEARNRVRATGLIVPPSPDERAAMGGRSSTDRFPSGLIVPK
jgi:hypothetical protein